MDTVEIPIKIPSAAMDMFVAAAELQGWQATINDKPNPTSAFEFCRNSWFDQVRAQATQRLAQKRQAEIYEEANNQTASFMDAMKKANP